MADNDLKKLTHETFEPLVGETFRFDPGKDVEEPFDVVLSGVELSPHEGTDTPGDGVERKPFSLLFHAEGHHHVDQQILTVSHGKLGDVGVFVVPHGPDARGMVYGAVFS